MLPAERIEAISGILKTKRFSKVEELSKIFNVSVMTIRRDIEKMEQLGVAKRFYGGIIQRSDFARDMGYSEKVVLNLDAKRAIAAFCYKNLYPESGVIYLDTGSTVLELAKLMCDKLTDEQCQAQTIITNDIIIANLLLNRSFKLIMIGGTIQNPLGCVHGYTAMNQLDHLRIDVAFCSGLSVDALFNLLAFSESKVYYRQKLIDHSSRNYLMLDSSKLYNQSLFYTHKVDVYDAVISDRELSEEEARLAKEYRITWISASPNSV